ncbi:MAG: deoxyribonuclease IV [Chlamydiae bacterium]|nr:deoxyribonuclease IV [Chlamydiota bacterium]
MKKSPSDQLLIGAHTSTSGGLENALLQGAEIGATTIQIFTRNQKRWNNKPIDEKEAAAFIDLQQQLGIQKIMSHDSYLINLGCPNSDNLAKSRFAFKEEIQRCHALELSFLNFHPGSALHSSEEQCLDTIIESLLSLEKEINQGDTRILLEATAGQGSCVGYRFEHLGYIIEGVKHAIAIGVCIDTCHIFAAGYDIRDADALNITLKEFDKTVGLDFLYAFHLNDSLKPFASRRDRHAPLGEGEIGIACFKALMQNPKTREIPKYLETPDGPSLWTKEIAMLREFANL